MGNLKNGGSVPHNHNKLGWRRVIICSTRLPHDAKAPLQAVLAKAAGHQEGKPNFFGQVPENIASFHSCNTGHVRHFTSVGY